MIETNANNNTQSCTNTTVSPSSKQQAASSKQQSSLGIEPASFRSIPSELKQHHVLGYLADPAQPADLARFSRVSKEYSALAKDDLSTIKEANQRMRGLTEQQKLAYIMHGLNDIIKNKSTDIKEAVAAITLALREGSPYIRNQLINTAEKLCSREDNEKQKHDTKEATFYRSLTSTISDLVAIDLGNTKKMTDDIRILKTYAESINKLATLGQSHAIKQSYINIAAHANSLTKNAYLTNAFSFANTFLTQLHTQDKDSAKKLGKTIGESALNGIAKHNSANELFYVASNSRLLLNNINPELAQTIADKANERIDTVVQSEQRPAVKTLLNHYDELATKMSSAGDNKANKIMDTHTTSIFFGFKGSELDTNNSRLFCYDTAIAKQLLSSNKLDSQDKESILNNIAKRLQDSVNTHNHADDLLYFNKVYIPLLDKTNQALSNELKTQINNRLQELEVPANSINDFDPALYLKKSLRLWSIDF